MDFKDNILKLAERIKVQKDAVKTEEATKTSFILPLIATLGYDVFDPFEVIPEMDCDLTKRGDKIDYAIQKNGKTILIIECKHCTSNLNLHDTQLSKYYAASNARFGVLTNGIEYRFYADLEKNNIMDEKPFLVVDITDLSNSDIEQLKKFHKSYFDESDILSTAQELKYSTEIKNIIVREFKEPSWDFVKFFGKQVYNGQVTQKVVDLLTPIIKKSLESVINDTIQDRLKIASKVEPEKNEPLTQEEPQSEDGIITTEEELEAYQIIRSILRKDIPVEHVIYKDFKSYFVVSAYKQWCWVCRLKFGTRKKSVSFPLPGYKGESSIEIKKIDDIFNLSDKLYEALGNAKNAYNKYYKVDVDEKHNPEIESENEV